MIGKLDKPGGALRFEIVDVTAPGVEDAPLVVFHHGVGASADIWVEWLPDLVGGAPDMLQRLAVYYGKGTNACSARSRKRGCRPSSAVPVD